MQDFLLNIPNGVVLVAVAALLVVGNAGELYRHVSKLIVKQPEITTELISNLDDIAEYVAVFCTGDEREKCLASYDQLRKVLTRTEATDAKDV